MLKTIGDDGELDNPIRPTYFVPDAEKPQPNDKF
jgi:hypothetical protein